MTLSAVPAAVLDPADAPDRTAAFLARARPYEERLSRAADGSAAATDAAAYARFLDIEMNRACRQLLGQLDPGTAQALRSSQRRWLQFRDAEARFIDANWVPRNFGSSSALARTDHRSSLVRQRVLTLLEYLCDYPGAGR